MTIRVAVLGAHTYWGAETMRLLSVHPQAVLQTLISDEKAGSRVGDIYPHLFAIAGRRLEALDGVDWSKIDCLIAALPHNQAHLAFAALPAGVKGIDLSADFRFSDVAFYEKYYGPHRAAALQREAVYGLSEIERDAIRGARIVGTPGCYPTAAQLPLVPLLAAGLIEADDIVIDAKSGVSGAGRAPDELHMYCEVAEGVHPYRVGHHRLAPEIELGLSKAAGKPVVVSFTPHMVPMNRGTLATMYVRMCEDVGVADLRAELQRVYGAEPFMRLLPEGMAPATRMVRGSNFCVMNVFAERAHRRAVLIAAIDNVVKGGAGQAVQNMNLMFGLAETTGLEQLPLFP
jgi:N-acetyl-gamma-glutamyl-phosphate reductase